MRLGRRRVFHRPREFREHGILQRFGREPCLLQSLFWDIDMQAVKQYAAIFLIFDTADQLTRNSKAGWDDAAGGAGMYTLGQDVDAQCADPCYGSAACVGKRASWAASSSGRRGPRHHS